MPVSQDWVQTFDGQNLIKRPLARFKKDRAPFMLEVWRYEKPEREINTYIRTHIWLTGKASLPGPKGIVEKDIDTRLRACPRCNRVILPPVPQYTQIYPGTQMDHKGFVRDRDGNPVHPPQRFICTKCHMDFPGLVTDHLVCGTFDTLGAHMVWRYNQLRDILARKTVEDRTFADQVHAPEAADVLYRVLKRNVMPHVAAVLRGEHGAMDRLLKAHLVNNSEAAYIYADDLARELSKTVVLETYFRNLLRA
jgi:hypothetical protein